MLHFLLSPYSTVKPVPLTVDLPLSKHHFIPVKRSYLQAVVEQSKLSNTNDKGAKGVSAMMHHLFQHTRQSHCAASKPYSDANSAAPAKSRIPLKILLLEEIGCTILFSVETVYCQKSTCIILFETLVGRRFSSRHCTTSRQFS